MSSNSRIITANTGSFYSLQIEFSFSCSLLDIKSFQAQIQNVLVTFYDQYQIIIFSYIPNGFDNVNFNISNIEIATPTYDLKNCGKRF